jgi:hypothetical protein
MRLNCWISLLLFVMAAPSTAMTPETGAQATRADEVALADLVGSYALSKVKAPSVRITKSGADYLWSNRSEKGSWSSPQKGLIVTDAERSVAQRTALRGVLAQLDMRGDSADQSASLFRPQLIVVDGIVTWSPALPAVPLTECAASVALRTGQTVVSSQPRRSRSRRIFAASSRAFRL